MSGGTQPAPRRQRAGFRRSGPAAPHAPCGKPGIPLRGAPTSPTRAIAAYLEELGPASTGRCLGPRASQQPPRAPSWPAERRAPPRPAPPRSVGHTQARASSLPTPRRAGPGRGRGRRREARGARHEARGTGGDALAGARRAWSARARAAWAGGAGSGQLLLPIFCLVSCQKKKNINSRAVSFSCRRGAWTPARTSE